MRDYLAESQDWLDSPVPIREMLARDYDVVLASIVGRLRLDDTYARKYAAYCLGQIGDPRMEEYLEQALRAEKVEGVRHAMVAALKTIRKLPKVSGATEEQRCQYMQEVYEAGLPDHIRKKMLAERAKAGDPPANTLREHSKAHRTSSTPAKTSGCLIALAGSLLMMLLGISFLIVR